LIFNKRKIEKLSDSELAKHYRKTKNIKFFGHIFSRYAHLVYGVCLKYLKNTTDAEDAMMQIFEKSIIDFKNNEITYPKAIPLDSINEIDNYENETNQIEEKVLKEKKIEQLQKSISELKEDQKVVITLFYLEKKSYQEIANETGWELKKIKSEIQNGKRNLKLKVKEKE